MVQWVSCGGLVAALPCMFDQIRVATRPGVGLRDIHIDRSFRYSLRSFLLLTLLLSVLFTRSPREIRLCPAHLTTAHLISPSFTPIEYGGPQIRRIVGTAAVADSVDRRDNGFLAVRI